MDGRFVIQVLAIFVITLIGIFAFQSESLQATVATAFKQMMPEKLTSEQILARQKESRLKLENAYIDFGPFWRDGESIYPDKFGLGEPRESTWRPPFFMPVPQTIMAKIAETDVDPGRFKERQRYINAALALSEDRCSASLRKELMRSFVSYTLGYIRSVQKDTVYYYATLEDSYIVGLHINLLAEGYLTLADFKRKKIQSKYFKTSYFVRRIDDAERVLQERRRCPKDAG